MKQRLSADKRRWLEGEAITMGPKYYEDLVDMYDGRVSEVTGLSFDKELEENKREDGSFFMAIHAALNATRRSYSDLALLL
eukprot:326633-Lingulodinium_polyedra.AAC.1